MLTAAFRTSAHTWRRSRFGFRAGPCSGLTISIAATSWRSYARRKCERRTRRSPAVRLDSDAPGPGAQRRLRHRLRLVRASPGRVQILLVRPGVNPLCPHVAVVPEYPGREDRPQVNDHRAGHMAWNSSQVEPWSSAAGSDRVAAWVALRDDSTRSLPILKTGCSGRQQLNLNARPRRPHAPRRLPPALARWRSAEPGLSTASGPSTPTARRPRSPSLLTSHPCSAAVLTTGPCVTMSSVRERRTGPRQGQLSDPVPPTPRSTSSRPSPEVADGRPPARLDKKGLFALARDPSGWTIDRHSFPGENVTLALADSRDGGGTCLPTRAASA